MNQKTFKLLTATLALGVCGYLAYHVSQRKVADIPDTEASVENDTNDDDAEERRRELESLTLGSFGTTMVKDDSEPDQDAVGARDISLRVGVIGGTPMRTDLTAMESFPFEKNELFRTYRGANDRACRLIVPGVAVSPPLTQTRRNQGGSLGRMTAMTIGLNFDTAGTKKLPAVTRGQVTKYFAEHRLAVQPVLHRDSQNRPYFGTDCQAAFFELERPGMTVKAEPMISIAVGRFRALGLVPDVSEEDTPRDDILGRTLALAFTFQQKDETVTGAADASRVAMEVLLLHLTPDCTADDPQVQAFVTSDDRTNLHRLDTNGMRLNGPTPVITADVRFNKTKLMGMYPDDPVVSGIDFRSTGILSMDTIKRLSTTTSDRPAISITEILDQFGKLAGEPMSNLSITQ
ncbi:MAG: hypothetical protein AAFX06_03120 [Planctomycetota bacterium]